MAIHRLFANRVNRTPDALTVTWVDGIRDEDDLLPDDTAVPVKVATLASTTGANHTFTLQANPGSKFAIQNTNELWLTTALDYNIAASHALTIRITNAIGIILDTAVLVTVVDMSPSIEDADAAAYIALWDDQSTPERRQAIHTYVTGLKAANRWTNVDSRRIHCLHTEQASLIDLRNPALPISTVTGTALFTENRGHTWNGSSNLLDTQVSPVGLTYFTQNACSIFSFSISAEARLVNGDWGVNRSQIGHRNSSNLVKFSLNGGFLPSTSQTGADGQTGIVVTRRTVGGATTVHSLIEGGTVRTDTAASIELRSGTFNVGAVASSTEGLVAESFSTGKIGITMVGGPIDDDAGMQAEITLARALLDSLGSFISPDPPDDELIAELGYTPPFYYGSGIEPTSMIWISPTGSDTTGTGSRLNPYKQLKHACQQHLAPGVAFVLRGGNHVLPAQATSSTHYLGLNVTSGVLAVDGTDTHPIWITFDETDGLHSARVIPTAPCRSWISLSGRENYIIDGIHLEPTTWGAAFGGILATGGSRADCITIRRMLISAVAEDGLKFSQCQGGIYIYDNVIWDVGEEEIDFVAVVPHVADTGTIGKGGIVAYNELYHKGYHTGQGPAMSPTMKAGTTDVLVLANLIYDVATLSTAPYGIGCGAGGGSQGNGTSVHIAGFGTLQADQYEAKRVHHKGNLVYDVSIRAMCNLGAKSCDFDENILERGSLTAILNEQGNGVIVDERPKSINNRYRNNRVVHAAGTTRISNGAGCNFTESGNADYATVALALVDWPWIPGPRWKYGNLYQTNQF
jgi:hypothetical protein